MKFTLEIESDNSQLQVYGDIALSLETIAEWIHACAETAPIGPSRPHVIRDSHGNNVGQWEVIEMPIHCEACSFSREDCKCDQFATD